MKAKILGFFCSLLIINFAYGQTIDGRLYTQFNNYYKWRGGAFDSTLLLPDVSASGGKRAGAIRYSAADSSVYTWSGTQWIKVNGGAAIPYVDTLFLQNDTLKYTKNSVNYSVGYVGDDTATVVKAYVTNAEAVTITKGQVVYIFGASGDRAAVKLAKNTSDTFSSKTLGIVRADIAAGAAGWVTTQGQVSGINLGAYTAGDVLWLDSVPGAFTNVRPQAPYHGVFVGVVERANAGNGLIYVKPQNGVELEELHDVKLTSSSNNQVLAYTASTGIWENKTIENILQFDTIPLAAFGAGSGAASDTAAFTTSAVYGSFYNAGSDTLVITQMRAGVLGTSPNITTEVYWNDSLNVTAGATILVTGGTSVTGTIGATNVTSFTNNKIPPNNWVFVRTSAVATKPTYFTLTLLGYRKRQ